MDVADIKKELKKQMRPGHTPAWETFVWVKEQDPLKDDLMLTAKLVVTLDETMKEPYVDNPNGADTDVVRGYLGKNGEPVTFESANRKTLLTVIPHVEKKGGEKKE